MKKRDYRRLFRILAFLGIVSSTFNACELIFETPLTDKQVYIIMPADGIETDISSQTFWWEPVPESKGYDLQIVSPSFDTIQKLVIDTSIIIEKFEYSLFPGRFQWRVRAYNNNTSTEFFIRSITVLNTYDLSNQSVVLKSPNANFVTRDTTIIFSWYLLNNATDYRFELKYNSWQGDYVLNPILTDLNTVMVNLYEGLYAWGVQGQNQNSGSIFSHRTFMIDTTRPGQPILDSPGDEEVLTQSEVLFSWTRPDTTGSVIKDSLFISTDSTFMNLGQELGFFLLETELKTDVSDPGRYFWRVRSIDAAGNKSDYSMTRKFIRSDEE